MRKHRMVELQKWVTMTVGDVKISVESGSKVKLMVDHPSDTPPKINRAARRKRLTQAARKD